jgi:hypothetical protein
LNSDGYFKRASRIVFADGTWRWKCLIAAVVSLTPLVGAFPVLGYRMVLSRNAAWGIDRGLPPLSEYRQILKQAVNGFIVSVVWELALIVPLLVLITVETVMAVTRAGHATSPILPWWNTYAVWLPSMALMALTNIAILRTAVYLKPSAGLSIAGVFALIKRNPAGFRSVTLLAIGVQAISLLLRTPIILARFIPQIPAPVLTYGWGLVVAAVVVPLMFVVAVAYGLWAQDTDPASWPPLMAPAVPAPTDAHLDSASPAQTLPTDSPFDEA